MCGAVECVGFFLLLPPAVGSLFLGKRESTAKFDPAVPVTPYTAENGQFGPLLKIECRGLEFVGFDPSVSVGYVASVTKDVDR